MTKIFILPFFDGENQSADIECVTPEQFQRIQDAHNNPNMMKECLPGWDGDSFTYHEIDLPPQVSPEDCGFKMMDPYVLQCCLDDADGNE